MSVPNQLFTNNATSLLDSPVSPIATSLTVMTGYGALFPQPIDPGDFFLVTLENQTGSIREIIRVEGRSGDTFTNITRGVEGTVPQTWTATFGNDTLVDHRVTAETMRQALLQPVGSGGGIAGINIEEQSVPIATAATTLNFTGNVDVFGTGAAKEIRIRGIEISDQGVLIPGEAIALNFIGNVAVVDNGSSKDINIGAFTSPIVGETSPTPTVVPAGGTIGVSDGTYSQYSRGFKFYVTLYQPSTFRSASFEVMANISGDLSVNAEAVAFSRYGRVGYNFNGNVVMSLNTTTKVVSLAWNNLEAVPVEVMSIRIQHLA